MTLTGTIGADWLRKHGAPAAIADETLRAWRDFLEARLLEELKIEADFSIGETTAFRFILPHGDHIIAGDHTIVEIEAFTRRALDLFLDKEGRNS